MRYDGTRQRGPKLLRCENGKTTLDVMHVRMFVISLRSDVHFLPVRLGSLENMNYIKAATSVRLLFISWARNQVQRLPKFETS